MVLKQFRFVVLVALAGVLVMGCTKGEDNADADAVKVKSAADKPVSEVVSSFEETKNTYLGAVKSTVKEWDGKLDALLGAKDALPAVAQAPLEEPMKTLLSRRDDVSKKLSAVESSTEDSFEAKRSELNSALDSFSGAYKKVADLF